MISTVDGVIFLAMSTLYNWERAQDKSLTPTAAFLTEADGESKWVKPDGEVIKINVDAAIFFATGTYSYACVARDRMGLMQEAISKCRAGVVRPEMAEAMGVREALGWIKRKSWSQAVIETDSLAVVQSIRSSLPMFSYFGGVIHECRDLLRESNGVSLLFIRRSANTVAHYLARASYIVADRIVGRNEISPEFLDVIMKDYQ